MISIQSDQCFNQSPCLTEVQCEFCANCSANQRGNVGSRNSFREFCANCSANQRANVGSRNPFRVPTKCLFCSSKLEPNRVLCNYGRRAYTFMATFAWFHRPNSNCNPFFRNSNYPAFIKKKRVAQLIKKKQPKTKQTK